MNLTEKILCHLKNSPKDDLMQIANGIGVDVLEIMATMKILEDKNIITAVKK